MGILNSQLITGAPPELEGAHHPFSSQLSTEASGFGGYSYAPDADLQAVFGTTIAADFFGPFGTQTLGSTTKYGPVAFRMSDSDTSLLTQLAEAIAPLGSEETAKVWSTTPAGQKMAYSFSTFDSDATRSFRDKTIAQYGGGPAASGGQSQGYEFGHQYEVTSWYAPAVPPASAKSWKSTDEAGFDAHLKGGGEGKETWTSGAVTGWEIEVEEIVEGSAATNTELQRVKTNPGGGLRNLTTFTG